MISEPEMVGDYGTPELSGTVEPPAAERVARRPWLWALGGAVVASAVWAGGLSAFGGDRLPDTRGYRVDVELCEDAKLAALTRELGKKADSPPATMREHGAVDRANCVVPLLPSATGAKGFTMDHEVWLAVELHKKADPATEFEANLTPNERYEGVVSNRAEAVPGLGDEAFLVSDDEDFSAPLLKVRDGGAVFTLQVSVSVGFSGDGEPPDGDFPQPDVSGLEPLMIEDMRELMSALKK